MKWLGILFFSVAPALAAPLEIPEKCLSEKKAPCLVKAQDGEETIKVNNLQVRLLKDTLVQWDSLDSVLALSLLKGSVQIRNSGDPVTINKIPSQQQHLLIAKKDQLLNFLDLKTFMLSTFILAQVQSNSVLAKSVFVEKAELFGFVVPFFQTSSSFKKFITEIAPLWKHEFKTQTVSQTKVLTRAIASAEVRDLQKQQTETRNLLALKKVRDEFFYRTFYR